MSEIDNYIYCPRCKNELILKKMEKTKVKACDNCGFIFWNNPKPTTSMLIHDDGKTLMIQRAKDPFRDYWVLPGGFVKADESPQKTILRELKEETGIDGNIEGIVGVYLIENDPRGIHIDIIFHGIGSGVIQLSKEDKAWKYFSKDKLPEKIAYKHRDAIMDWYNNQNV